MLLAFFYSMPSFLMVERSTTPSNIHKTYHKILGSSTIKSCSMRLVSSSILRMVTLPRSAAMCRADLVA